jgi:hypothetical protein
MPSSPLHSSGLATDSGSDPTRHLVRLTLPTAQYEISTVLDPLTGEMQSAPPKPAWLRGMQEGEAVVSVEVRAGVEGSGATATDSRVVVAVVLVSSDGSGASSGVHSTPAQVKVANEKESLTALGREDLLDSRVAKMGVLSRLVSRFPLFGSLPVHLCHYFHPFPSSFHSFCQPGLIRRELFH